MTVDSSNTSNTSNTKESNKVRYSNDNLIKLLEDKIRLNPNLDPKQLATLLIDTLEAAHNKRKIVQQGGGYELLVNKEGECFDIHFQHKKVSSVPYAIMHEFLDLKLRSLDDGTSLGLIELSMILPTHFKETK